MAIGTWYRQDGEDHHVPLDEYKANLKTIIAHIRALHAEQRIILITPPPVDDVRCVRSVLFVSYLMPQPP